AGLSDSSEVVFARNLDLPDRTHYFSVRFSDLASSKRGKNAVTRTVGPIYFIVDRAAPSLDISTPGSDSLHADDFTLGGTASDASGLSPSGLPGDDIVLVLPIGE